MKLIQLGKQQVFTIVDDNDFDYLNQFSWYEKKKKSGSSYAYREIYNKGKRTIKFMHRELLALPSDDKRQGEHINHNGLDNQRHNIRIATHQQNSFNHRKNKSSKFNFKGIKLNVWKSNYTNVKGEVKLYNNSYFRAVIHKSGKAYYGPNRKTDIEAAIDYNRLALLHHGEFACLNKIPEKIST